MVKINYCTVFIFLFMLNFARLSQSSFSLVPVYNSSTGCHHLSLADKNLTFAICLQRSSNRQHPYNLHTAPSFCSKTYPPNGHLIDIFTLSSTLINTLFQSLVNLFNTYNFHRGVPKPDFLWIAPNPTNSVINDRYWCPEQNQAHNQSHKALVLRTRYQYYNHSQPCIAARRTHWDRAPFICLINQTIVNEDEQMSLEPVGVVPSYSSETIVFYDAASCLVVRTLTHQYTFCFRRQSCPNSKTSAYCTTQIDAYLTCHEEKNGSNLLTIENDDEYQLISDIVSYYSNETLINSDGSIIKSDVSSTQWMWIDGITDSNQIYRWSINNSLVPIADKYWCDNVADCSGGKGRDGVALTINCQSNNKTQLCLASKLPSAPGPFICKRILRETEERVLNFTFLRDAISPTTSSTTTTSTLVTVLSTDATTTLTTLMPVYEKNMTEIYYDEQHCLTVETRSHIYQFCFRRQNCTGTKAYCTKWIQAQHYCSTLKSQATLLTIENDDERRLITDITRKYVNETRLTFNGSSHQYFLPSKFIWVDGVQQGNKSVYLWNNETESIPEHLWCSTTRRNTTHGQRVRLNLDFHKKDILACLDTRQHWDVAPYICKRKRPTEHCPMTFNHIRNVSSNEMFVLTNDRMEAWITCKHPEYSSEIRIKYICDTTAKRWEKIFENDRFHCPIYKIPEIAANDKRPLTSQSSTTSTSTQTTNLPVSTSHASAENQCPESELQYLKAKLPVDARIIDSRKLKVYSLLYYDIQFVCRFNHSIQITYRCNMLSKQWIYVYGFTNRFHDCSKSCYRDEGHHLLNKYFSTYQQTKIRRKHINNNKSIRFSCFNQRSKQRQFIDYKCGTMTITKSQWFRMNSCFESHPTGLSKSENQSLTQCPPTVIRGSPCENASGVIITDERGCQRKVCPSISKLCDTIRCPPDRICRVKTCALCHRSDYLQPVCETVTTQISLSVLKQQSLLLSTCESIDEWEHQMIILVKQYANEQRARLKINTNCF